LHHGFPRAREVFEKEVAQLPDAPAIRVLDGQAQQRSRPPMRPSSLRNRTLETLSAHGHGVAYRVSAVTAFLLRTMGLVKVRYFSQPNLLAGRRLVPEFFQEQVSGAALGTAAAGTEDHGHGA